MRLAALLLACLASAAWAQDAPHQVEGRRSGYTYMGPSTQALQDDPFLNPGMFAVDTGRALWSQPIGPEGQSCASCHSAGDMIGVAARYPAIDAETGGLLNLELRINRELEVRMGAEPFAYETAELIALTAYVSAQSAGMPMEVAVEGPAAPFFEQGRDYYYTRRGQLDLNCANCHEDNAGLKLRGDVISQGQINAFPIYRLLWDEMGSRHRMFAWCNTSVRAEPAVAGSEDYVALELYLAWRGRGLPIEAPGVRR